MNKIITKNIESKKIVWFEKSNSYAVFENDLSDIISCILTNNLPLEKTIFEVIDASVDELNFFIKKLKKLLLDNEEDTPKTTIEQFLLPTSFYSEKLYSINNLLFLFQFETKSLEFKIHPLFAHHEVNKTYKPNFVYVISNNKNCIQLCINSLFIGAWKHQEAHLFKGKLFMQLIIDCYQKPEENWMGVFHASAVRNKNEAILFLGESGSGKSTSLAVLNAFGYDCIADDFVPIDNQKKIHFFPAAISLKKNSLSTLTPFYPGLENSMEYHLNKTDKIVRYLPPKKTLYKSTPLCKALVFITYNTDIAFEVKQLSKIDALQLIIHDSWISPIEKNASMFMDWFLEMPCYQITHSNNNKLVDCITKLFHNDL